MLFRSIITLAVTSNSEPLTKVYDLVDTRLAQKISQLAGVGLVTLEGGQKPGVRIRANPTALAAYNLNIDDLRTTITNANVNTPKGNFDGPTRAYTINANDQITDPKLFRDIIVAYRNGAPVRLSDVATVEDAQENNRLAAWMNTTPAVIVNVQRQPGANVIAVVDSIKALLPTLRDNLPSSLDVTVLTDRTLTIRASVHDVQIELGFAVLLVVAVLANFVSVLLKGLAWKGVVDGLPGLKHRTRYIDLLSPLMVGFLFNTILAARVGEIAKVLLAKRRLARRGEDLSTTVLLGTVVVENIITTIA